jgi:predicted ribosomally synthesized peptide with SipW-like signal peptide
MFGKKMVLSLLAVGVTALLVSAASFALFTAQATNNNNVFTAGTVTLNGPTGCSNTYNNIAPGDAGSFTCDVQYTGSLPAWVGYTAAFTGPGTLNTCDGANSLQVANLTNSKTVIGGVANPGDHRAMTFNWNLPLAAGNSCQGATTTVTVNFYAVQSANNTTGAGPTSWQ